MNTSLKRGNIVEFKFNKQRLVGKVKKLTLRTLPKPKGDRGWGMPAELIVIVQSGDYVYEIDPQDVTKKISTR